MTQLELLLADIPFEKLDLLTREELVMLLKGEQGIRKQLQEENTRLRALNNELRQKSLFVEEQLITIKNKLFGKSSERPANEVLSNNSSNKSKKKKLQLPSERYPDAALIERHVTLDQMPSCGCCGSEMEDSGMTEDSEYLTVVPKQFIVIREMLHKYRCCKCHGDIKTPPVPPRIKPGSAYSDEMMIDVSMSKYCDLIPIERYTRMAEREGLQGLP